MFNVSLGLEDHHIESLDGPVLEESEPPELPPEIAHRMAVFSEEAAKEPPALEGA